MINATLYIICGFLTLAGLCFDEIRRKGRMNPWRAFLFVVMATFWWVWVWFAIISIAANGLKTLWDREQVKQAEKAKRDEERKARRAGTVAE